MPWKSVVVKSLRGEFVELARVEGANRRELCRRFGISAPTGYKWIRRWEEDGLESFEDRSRAPKARPWRSSDEVEQAVVAARLEHPAWGGRKLRHWLINRGTCEPVPAASTISAILRRHGLLEAAAEPSGAAPKRFEREKPNELWQMDFKGHFALGDGSRCHPLGTIDDHSRFNISL